MTDPLEKSNLIQAEYFKDIIGTIREPLLVLDADLRVLAANRSFYKFFKVKAGETIGRLVYDLGDRQWDIPGLRLLLETILPQKALFNDFNVEHDFPVIGRRTLLLNARRARGLPDKAQWILLAFEDVTERMEMERSLQASEKQFHSVFETASDSMLLVDKISGKVRNSNRAAQDSLGYSKKALQKKNLWELGILKDRRQFRRISIKLEKQGVVGLVDATIPTSQGGDYPADITIMDRSEVIQCNIHGITERKQAEEKLYTSENELRSLFAAMTDVVFVFDGDGRYLRIGPTNPINLYRPSEEMLGKTLHEVLPKEQADYMIAKIGQAIETKQAVPGEYALQIDGKEIWFASRTSRLSENSVIWVAHDITERKQAEEALAESTIRFKWLYEYAPVAYHIMSPEGTITDVNHRWCELLGYRREEAIGKTIFDFVVEEEKEAAKDSFKKKKLTEQSFTEGNERNFRTKDGRVITVKTYDSFSLDERQNLDSVQTTIENITERKQAEKQLKEYSEHLEEMVEERTRELRQAQDELVRKEKLAVLGALAGSVGHELRNPLGVISSSVYYLNLVQPDANEKIKKHHTMIEQQVQIATQIISDLLDYARVITTNPKPASVRELVEHMLSRFPAPASIQVRLKIPTGMPKVYVDPLHVEQILGNLVTNACQAMVEPSSSKKASSIPLKDGGKLIISARQKKNMVAIAVKDTGTGVAPENIGNLFEPLFSTKATGIGLGLAVSKKLAEANGGRIEEESKVGKGSTFTLYLPLKAEK